MMSDQEITQTHTSGTQAVAPVQIYQMIYRHRYQPAQKREEGERWVDRERAERYNGNDGKKVDWCQ